MWTQIRLLLGEQSALDLHYLFKRLHNISIDDKTYDCVVIYTLRDNKCVSSALSDRAFMKCTQACAAQAILKRLTNRQNSISFLEQLK